MYFYNLPYEENKMLLQGVYTALVTPFRNGEVDWKAFEQLLEAQVAGNVAGVVPVGTTGESPTLSTEEHIEVIARTVEIINGRCQVIAGSGANSTEEAIHLTREAKAAGADATLQVTPYYNKPTQEGIYRHFTTVADETGLPVVLYNVPGRAGVPIGSDSIARLSKHPLMVAVKGPSIRLKKPPTIMLVARRPKRSMPPQTMVGVPVPISPIMPMEPTSSTKRK